MYQPNEEHFAVSIRGLRKTFGKKTAVNGLSLDIPVGSFYGMVGPNGAGKTTTLNMLVGLLHPDEGQLTIFGHDVWSDVSAAQRMIGVMPESEQIFSRLTGRQLLVYSGMLRDMKRAEAIRRANDLLAAFDLQDAANVLVSDYSAGMTKKICLATAMIHSPRLLILDEPFESVDPVSSANLRDILLEYAATGGTVIISSHVMALVEKMCTHVAIVADGSIRAAGTVEEVAAGEDLEERFLQYVGGRHTAAKISWLDGARARIDEGQHAYDTAGVAPITSAQSYAVSASAPAAPASAPAAPASEQATPTPAQAAPAHTMPVYPTTGPSSHDNEQSHTASTTTSMGGDAR